MQKRYVVAVLMLAVLLSGVASVMAERTQIEFVTHWGTSGYRVETLEHYIAEYNALQSEVEVVHAPYPWQTINDKILVEIIGGVPPAIIHISTTAVPSFVTQELLQPVPTEVETTLRESLLPGAVNLGTYEGRLWGPPTQNVSRALIINQTLFDRYGVASEGPQTWNELEQMGARFRSFDAEGNLSTTGITIDGAPANEFTGPLFSLAKSHGGEFLDESGTRVTVDSDEWVETMEFVKGLIDTNVATVQYNPTFEWFMEDKAAIYLSPGSWKRMQFVEARGSDWVSNLWSAPIPAGQTGQTASHQYGYILAVPIGVDYPEEAWDFITWITTHITDHGTTPMGDIMVADGNLPNTAADVQNQPLLRDDFMHGFVDALANDYVFLSPPIPNINEMHSQLISAFEGKQSVTEALRQSAHAMQVGWDEFLQQQDQ